MVRLSKIMALEEGTLLTVLDLEVLLVMLTLLLVMVVWCLPVFAIIKLLLFFCSKLPSDSQGFKHYF